MGYSVGLGLLVLAVIGLFGCTEQSQIAHMERKRAADNIIPSEESVRSVKEEAEALTPAGKRENGLFHIDYQKPGYKDIVVMVKRAQDYLQRNGRIKALDDFMSPDSQFVAGRVYIFAYSTSGECLAEWGDPEKVGCFMDGEFIANAIAKASSGGGWIDEVAIDPVSRESRNKESYVLLAQNDIIIGAGLYKD